VTAWHRSGVILAEFRPLGSTVVAAGLVALLPACGSDATVERACDVEGSALAAYRIKGSELLGDVDGDGTADRVTLRRSETRPTRCRHVLVVERGEETAVVPVKPLPWPGTNPELLLLAEIDGREGLEPVVALSPANVYEPGAVFTMREGELLRMRREVEAQLPEDLFPFDDEFPAGVDCAAKPGTIVATSGILADRERDDRHWDVTRSFYRAVGTRFELLRDDDFLVEVGPGAAQRWPELRSTPFLSCPGRVG
jgi:hypothetical protein